MVSKISIAIIVSILSFAALASAQSAWTPPKGTYSLAISYQNNFSDRHSFGDGRDYPVVLGQKITDNGSTRNQSAYLDFGYAITDKLAIGFDIPYMAEKYDKPK